MMLLETASLKTPMICADIRENRDIFSDADVLYALPEDVNDWAEKLEWALTHGQEMQNKAQKAFDKLSNRYSWSTIAADYNSVYNSILP